MARRCLYYPYIHFRDEAWLKLSSLYWDDVTRIVPRAYAPHDSRDVRQLEEAGVIRRVDPAAYEQPVSRLFELLLERHAAALVRRYNVSERETWPDNPERFGVKTGRVTAKSLAFIHGTKLEPTLVKRLLELKLALPSHDKRWLGMHPAIVSAYMIGLAGEIATRRGLAPISDNPSHLSGVSSCSASDLARSLVGDVNLAKKRATAAAGRALEPTAERVAFVTLRAALPGRLDAVPIKQIVKLRRDHADLRVAFHGYVDGIKSSLASADIADPDALDEHIRLEYERQLRPQVLELSRELRSLGVSSFLGAVGVALAVPLGTVLGASPSAAATALVGSGLGVAALAHKQREAARNTLKPSPASFLFMTQKLGPKSLGERMGESLRRFSLGV